MNLTLIIGLAAAIGAGTFYVKGRTDESRRKELAQVIAAKQELEAKIKLARQLHEMSAQDAMKVRKEFLAKKEEADVLRKELEERGKVVACHWTPSQRSRLRKITVRDKSGSTPGAGQRGEGAVP
jgi:hypothetical protein